MISVVEQPCLLGLGCGPFRDPPGSSCLPPIIGRGVRRYLPAPSRKKVCLVFGLTWVCLGHEIRYSALLKEEFETAVRRLIGTSGMFVIPVGAYFLDGTKQYANNAESFAFAWGACYAVSLLILVRSLITLMRDANYERRTGFTDSGGDS